MTHSQAPRRLRTGTLDEDRMPELFELDSAAFCTPRDAESERDFPRYLPWDRTVAVDDADGRLVAFHTSFPFTLPVPGATVASAGLSWVMVRPDHRRRGLLTEMMATHLGHCRERGEALSVLGAAEPAIYGRFGYGTGADDVRLTLSRGAPLRPVPGAGDLEVRFEPLAPERDVPVLRALEAEQDRLEPRPGRARRGSALMWAPAVYDPPVRRHGAEPLQLLTVHDAGRVRAAALVRRTARWEASVPQGEVEVVLLTAIGAAATHRVWEVLLDLDLTTTVRTPHLPVDDPLLALLVDVRAGRPALVDNLWVRVVDVPTALGTRRYAAPLDVVLEMTDAHVPANAGRWRVRTEADDDGTHVATVARADDDKPELVLDVRELGAVYLGGRPLTALASAGLVTARRPGTLLQATTALGWPVAPCSPWLF